MSLSQGAALSAIAFQFGAALHAYDHAAARLVLVPGDLELYRAVMCRMDEMRRYASALPELAVPWVELMIRHFELTHALWRMQQGGAAAGELEEVRVLHDRAVQFLSARLLHLLPRQ